MEELFANKKATAALSPQPLSEIKLVVKGIEADIMSFVPEALIVDIEETPGGVLTGCAPGGASWGSNTSAIVTRQPDLGELVDDLRAGWSRADQFKFELTERATGEPRLVLRSEALGNYYVERIQEYLQVASFSTCFAYDEKRDGYAWEIAAE